MAETDSSRIRADGGRDVAFGLRDWLHPRARVVFSALALGVVAGMLGTAALGLYAGDPRFARSQVFALGALALGFGVLGWSGSVLGGRGVENMQQYLETGTDWTEADSRRAMARIAGFGGGMMLGVTVVESLL